MKTEFPPQPIILFDGVCRLCGGLIRFLIRLDRRDAFRFGLLQSENAQELLKGFGSQGEGLTTVVVLEGGNIAVESDAVLAIARILGGPWSLLAVLRIVPKVFRDGLYRFISRHRYDIFGQRDSCMIPTPDLMDKFI